VKSKIAQKITFPQVELKPRFISYISVIDGLLSNPKYCGNEESIEIGTNLG
jgi:hypothetical protein